MEERRKIGKAWEHLYMMLCEVDIGGGVQLQIPPESEFHTSQEEYTWFCEHLGSWLATECLMMKSSMLFQCGPPPTFTSCPPDVIHMISVSMPSHSSALY